MSIRFHLMIRLLLVSLILVGGGAIYGYIHIQYEARELFDAQLARSARLILSLVQADTDANNLSSIQQFLNENRLRPPFESESDQNHEETGSGHLYETKLGFQVWDDVGNLILKSQNVPITPITQENGFSDNYFFDYQWRIFSLTSQDSRYRSITAERIDVRHDLIGAISFDLAILYFILIPVIAITMWFAISRGLLSIKILASQIHKIGSDNLQSISVEKAPTEIKTITRAVNQLLSRLSDTLAVEKRITSDAAHELRTPLAAVKIHAELAKSATNKEDRIDSINHVLQGIDRTTHMVDQILALARLEPESFGEKLKPINLSNLVLEEVALLVPLAQSKNVELSICQSDDLTVSAEDTSLRLLIRNLLNNAVLYTQHEGEVEVYLSEIDNKACLIIKDNGPGIPAENRELVLQRFYREENHQTPGCGIGLSIVKRVVELLDASFIMEESDPDTGKGLKVTVCFQKAE